MDDLRHDDQVQVSFSGDESPAQWPIRPVVPPQRSYHFASQPQGYPSQHDGSQHGGFFHTAGIYGDCDTTGLSLTGDVLLEHQNPLQVEEQDIDPSLLNYSGAGEHGRAAVEPGQDGQHQPIVSTARIPYAGAYTPASTPAWINRTNRLDYRGSRLLALPTETPTKQPLKERSDPRYDSQGTMCMEDDDAGERNQWEWRQSPSEHTQEAQYNTDGLGSGRNCNTPHYGVSAEDAVVATSDLLDFFGQPQTVGMIAPNDLQALVRIWSRARGMQ